MSVVTTFGSPTTNSKAKSTALSPTPLSPLSPKSAKQNWVDKDQPFAELWIGDNVNGKSTFFMDDEGADQIDHLDFI